MRSLQGSMWRMERGMLVLILATVGVFAASVYSLRVAAALLMDVDATFRHAQLWRLATSAFVHLGLVSFLLGVLGLWWIGCFVERAIGTTRAVVMVFACTILGNLVVGLLALSLKIPYRMAGPGPALFGMVASTAFIYGRQQVLFFGAKPARADIIAYIFCGIILAMALIIGDVMGAVADLASLPAAYFVARRGRPSMDFGTRWAKLRLWWLRRRYKVLDGGKSKEKRWMN